MRPFLSAFLAVVLGVSIASAQTAATSCPATKLVTQPGPVALFDYDRAEALDLRDSLAFNELGVDVYSVSFASPKGGRVTGLLHLPHDSPRVATVKFPGVVMMHGAPGDAWGMSGIAMPVARHGAIVLVINAPFARRDKDNPLSFTPRDSAEQVQLIVDLQRAVDVLLTRSDVDASRIGFVGVSYGAAMGALFAGVERRIGAYVLLVGDGGLAARFTKPDGNRMARPPHLTAAQWCRWFAAMEPLASTRFIARADPAAVLFLWGRQDRLVPPYLADALARAAGKNAEARWYDAGHGLTPVAYLDMLDWLAGRIGTARVVADERAKVVSAAQ
ncbi:MAG: acetylxylan esterase [Gemmatimonadota bacterium]|nr:acetylxylan esterase [Gemmatimonadota bacterium]